MAVTPVFTARLKSDLAARLRLLLKRQGWNFGQFVTEALRQMYYNSHQGPGTKVVQDAFEAGSLAGALRLTFLGATEAVDLDEARAWLKDHPAMADRIRHYLFLGGLDGQFDLWVARDDETEEAANG